MSNYYAKQEGKSRIAEELIKRGWKVYNYRPSYFDSDPGCDYPYHSASWEGLATKNGFVLCVDILHYNVKNISGKKVYKYTENNISTIDYNKIEALKNMTQERGATAGEESNAKAMIEKIYAKAEKSNIDRENSKVLDYIYPTFQEHPTSATKWHIEKDGSIYDKGNGLTTFAKVPDIDKFNIDTMQFEDEYKYCYEWENGERVKKERSLTEEEEKSIKAFKNFILKLERVVNSMNSMGDGTKETEEIAQKQNEESKLIKVVENVTKKVLKMVEVKRDYFQEGDYLTFNHHGHYWKVTREYMQKGTWKEVTEERKAFLYERVGSSSRGYQQIKNTQRYYDYEFRMLKSLQEGKIKIFELKEVEEVQEVEKWVRKNINKTTTKKETVKVEVKENNETSEVKNDHNTNTIITATITLNEVKNGIEIRFSDKPDLDIRKEMKLNGFRWGGINNNCWYAKQSETSIKFANDLVNRINNTNNSDESFDDMNLDEVIIITEEDQSTGEALLDYSISIMEELGLNYKTYPDSQEYKNKLIETIKNHNLKLTKGVLQYLHADYELFEKVLKDLLKNINTKSKNVKVNPNTVNSINYGKLLEKVNSQMESNNKNIEKYSGDHKTNTWKRIKEQEGRDLKIKGFKHDNCILEYLKIKIEDNTVTALEQLLINKSFRENIDQYYNRVYAWTNSNKVAVEFPKYRPEWGDDNWYNKETKAKINRLNKANIFNTCDLLKVVDEYKMIMDSISNSNTIDLQTEKIKKLEREYRMQQKGDVNFTSKNVVEQLLEYANIQQGERVLEPNAGIGNIVDMIKQYTNNIEVCEYMYSYAELLKMKGYNVLCNDFMECNNYNIYDKIVMNPPFSNNQDIIHVKHAYECLKNNGRVVAITSNHWSFAQDKQSIDFRNWLDTLNHEVYDLPSGSFEFTNVACKILIINKDEQYSQQAI